MPPLYKIAVIQLHPKPLKIEENYRKAEQFIRNASAQGAHLAVLPEYHLTNWVPDDPKFNELSDQWETYLNKYLALAKELKISIVPGTIVERQKDDETGNHKLWNVAYFIGPDGTILGRYEKKNLWHPERPHLSSSQHDPHLVFDTPLGRVGMLICWDLAFPEAFRELIAQGAKIIIIPTFWTLNDCSPYGLQLNPKAEALFLRTMMTARAYENTAAIVFVNAGGPKGGTRPSSYAGLSQVAIPFVGSLGDATKESAEEGMSVVELDMQVLEEAEAQYKVREDMARSDWHYSYRHDDFHHDEFDRPKI